MANIEWRHTIPSEGSRVGIGDDDTRHQKRQVEVILNESFNVGDHANPVKPNAARFIDNNGTSDLSFAQADFWQYGGQVYWDSAGSRLYSFNTLPTQGVSNNTMISLVGTGKLVENADKLWPRATWVERSDSTTIVAAQDESKLSIDYGMLRAGVQPDGFDGIPTVFASVQGVGSPNPQPHLVQITGIQRDYFEFQIQRNDEDTASALTLFWSSLGTISGDVGGTF